MTFSFQPLPQSHPDVLAVAARKNGIGARSPSESRVLEIGCGDGSNLVPMAYFMPGATFVGVDLEPASLEAARSAAEQLGLGNARFLGWNDLDDAAVERFDEILVTNVFSFVSDERRGDIWAACRRWLSDDGVVFLRYCTEIGWLFRSRLAAVIRKYRKASGGGRGVDEVRRLLEIFDVEGLDEQNVYAKVANGEIRFARSLSDAELALFFENDHHRSFGFEEFCRIASTEGMPVFEEVPAPSGSQYVEHALRQRLFEAVGRYELIEEAVDFITAPTFRSMLLCHAGTRRDAGGTDERALEIGELAAALSSRSADVPLEEGLEVAFKTRNGSILRASKSTRKAILQALKTAWPRGLLFDELIAASEQALRDAGGIPLTDAERRESARELVALSTLGIVSIRSPKAGAVQAAGETPSLNELNRWQALRGHVLTTAHHDLLRLDDFSRLLVLALDGTRTRAALQAEMQQALADGRLQVKAAEGRPPPTSADAVGAMVQEVLEALEKAGLFRGRCLPGADPGP